MNQQNIEHVDETYRLIAADKVEGTKVENPEQTRLGDIKTVMIDKRSGHVAYAVMSFGGFLGIGERYHALPWPLLHYDVDRDAYVVNLDKEMLKNAPTYDANALNMWDDASYGQEIDSYYDVPPYATKTTF